MTETTSPAPARHPRHAVFSFDSASLRGHELRLRYRLTGGTDPEVAFEELLLLPATLPAPDPDDPVVQRLVDGCHRAFGVSYFKAALPPRIEAAPVGAADAAFWDLLYTEGMGEFYFRNGLSPLGKAVFPRVNASTAPLPGASAGNGSLVLLGGGKDSALVADIVNSTGKPAAALALGNSVWMQRSAAAARLPLHTIGRRLDPRLLQLNAAGAWNGHIPISACIAFVATLVGYAAGFNAVLTGNERGADDTLVELDGYSINHQWSKSLRFECAFREWCARQYTQGPSYFSLLRPLSEIHIAQLFAKLGAQHASFTSCNGNFRQQAGRRQEQSTPRWCGRCAKCVFVSLLLAPHLTGAQVQQIFGGDFLAEEYNRAQLQDLLGLGSGKPWDCVGTLQECRLSITALARQHRLAGMAAALVDANPGVLVAEFAEAWLHEFTPAAAHCLAGDWLEALYAYIRAPR